MYLFLSSLQEDCVIMAGGRCLPPVNSLSAVVVRGISAGVFGC